MPEGAPLYLTMDGILEGRIGDIVALEAAVRALNRLGIAAFELDKDGGKFSVMPENHQVPGTGFDDTKQEELLQQLKAVAAAARGPVESTMRCTMVFAEESAETLFRAAAPPPEGAGIEPLTRVRPRRASDVPAELPPPPPWRQLLKRREVVIALPLLVLAFSLMAWQTGLLDRLLSAGAKGISVETGAFGDLLAVEVESTWGNYEVTIRRGAGHPTSAVDWEARTGASATESQRLHEVVVREGQQLYVQVRDAADKVLAESSVLLRPLVTDPLGKATVQLPGRITASRVVLSVTKHETK